MFQIKDMTFSYEDTEGKDVIHHMDLSVETGSFVSIVGHSGCGKSTLLRLIAGLERPNAGSIAWEGQQKQKKTSVVFQDYSLFPWMTAEKNIVFSVRKMDHLRKKEATEKAKIFLEKVGMEACGDKYPCQLSGGMKQRVAIARAFACDTELLLMDEPFGALDVSTRKQMQELLRNVWQENKKKRTVLFVTHDIEEAMLISDRVIFMREGKIQEEYDICKVRDSKDEEKFAKVKRRIENAFYETC